MFFKVLGVGFVGLFDGFEVGVDFDVFVRFLVIDGDCDVVFVWLLEGVVFGFDM